MPRSHDQTDCKRARRSCPPLTPSCLWDRGARGREKQATTVIKSSQFWLKKKWS